jgi:hypothetical protein
MKASEKDTLCLLVDFPFSLRFCNLFFVIYSPCSVRNVPQLRVEEGVNFGSFLGGFVRYSRRGCHDVLRDRGQRKREKVKKA